MRFCVNCRHMGKTKSQAQELKVDYKDIEFIDDYIEKEQKQHYIVLKIPKEVIPDWELLNMYNEKMEGKFILCLDSLVHGPIAKSKNIKFYWNSPISTYFELNTILEIGVSQVVLGVPLIFDKNTVAEKIKAYDAKLRLVPNYSFTDYLYFTDGVCGGWIRPEDLVVWEDVAESCEFVSEDLKNERTIFDIYKRGKWPENLKLLIKGLSEDFYGQYLTNDFGINRSQCKQICQRRDSVCHYCYRAKNITNNYKQRDDNLKKVNS